jgi:hypothetical protein
MNCSSGATAQSSAKEPPFRGCYTHGLLRRDCRRDGSRHDADPKNPARRRSSSNLPNDSNESPAPSKNSSPRCSKASCGRPVDPWVPGGKPLGKRWVMIGRSWGNARGRTGPRRGIGLAESNANALRHWWLHPSSAAVQVRSSLSEPDRSRLADIRAGPAKSIGRTPIGSDLRERRSSPSEGY